MKRAAKWLWICVAAGLAPACTTQSGTGTATVTPGEDARPDAPEGRSEGDSRDELEARMHKLVAEQKARVEAASGSAAACEDLCSLATSICGVREKLCAIADEHPGDESYQALCREAKQECQAAQNDCVRCVERHATAGAHSESAGGQ